MANFMATKKRKIRGVWCRILLLIPRPDMRRTEILVEEQRTISEKKRWIVIKKKVFKCQRYVKFASPLQNRSNENIERKSFMFPKN